MAGTRRSDLLGKLSDLSDDAMQRLSDVPGGERLVSAINTTRDRVDELQKRVRGMDEIEKRLAALERKVEKLAKAGPSAGRKTPSAKDS
jgi:uncharacterized protein involved in exopolysaccharide biosynthesis